MWYSKRTCSHQEWSLFILFIFQSTEDETVWASERHELFESLRLSGQTTRLFLTQDWAGWMKPGFTVGPASVWSALAWGCNPQGRISPVYFIFVSFQDFIFYFSRSHRRASTDKIVFSESISCPWQDSRRTHTSVLLLLVCVSVFVGVFVLYLCASVCVCMPVCVTVTLCVTRFRAHHLPCPFFLSLPSSLPKSRHPQTEKLVSEPNVSSVLSLQGAILCACACVCVWDCMCVYYTCLIALGGETLSFIDISLYCLCRLWDQLPIIQPSSPL